jgi:hypothetical protein
MADPRRVEVGFSGGQAIALRVSDDAYERLRRALQSGGGWYEFETLDGLVAVNLAQVVFMRLENVEHRVGFSGL